MRRLPPLKAVRTFEAAARHLSFTRAADELHVTQAAVSHQIKALEEWLGVTLFRRQTRGVLLTDAGQAYLPALTGALDAIDRATRDLLRRDQAGMLTISALASFAAKWLSRGWAGSPIAIPTSVSASPPRTAWWISRKARLTWRSAIATAPGVIYIMRNS